MRMRVGYESESARYQLLVERFEMSESGLGGTNVGIRFGYGSLWVRFFAVRFATLYFSRELVTQTHPASNFLRLYCRGGGCRHRIHLEPPGVFSQSHHRTIIRPHTQLFYHRWEP